MLDDITSVTLQTALAGLSMRQRVTADNIANMETPNYHAKRVDFEASLRDAISSGTPADTIVDTTNTTDQVSQNGNNVNPDAEILTDEKTQLQYSLLSQAVSAKFNLIDTVLKG